MNGVVRSEVPSSHAASGNALPAKAAPTNAVSRLAAILLAAGRSSRLPGTNKLLRNFRGQPLLAHSLEAACQAGFAKVIVVTGREQAAVERLVRSRGAGESMRGASAVPGGAPGSLNINQPAPAALMLTHNPSYAQGLSTSLVAGIAALSSNLGGNLDSHSGRNVQHDGGDGSSDDIHAEVDAGVDGAAILLADMPLVTVEHLRRLSAAFESSAGRAIVVPTHAGRWGNPIFWPRCFFAELQQLRGDRGAKALALRHREALLEVQMPDDGVLFDVDTEEDFTARRTDGQ